MIKLKKSLQAEAEALQKAADAARAAVPGKPAGKAAPSKAAAAPAAPARPAGKLAAHWAMPPSKLPTKPRAMESEPAVDEDETSAARTKAVKAHQAPKLPRKKPKLIRKRFTFPERDYALIAALKEQAMLAGREFKKSEVLRAGLIALIAMSNKKLMQALDKVERVKGGHSAK